MNILRNRSLILVLAVASLALFWSSPASADDAAASKLPRYRLQVGQELIYQGRDDFKYEGGRFLTSTQWSFWVVRENPDHTWRIITKQTSAFKQSRGEESLADLLKNVQSLFEKEDVQKQYHVGWFDMHADGRIVENPQLGFHLRPGHILISLPQTAAEWEQGWKVHQSATSTTVSCRKLPESTAEQCTIEAISESPESKIYGVEQKQTVTFDLQRGLPGKIVTDLKQTYGFNGKGTGSLDLIEVKSHPSDWCDKFLAEAEKYIANSEAHTRAAKRRDLAPDEFKTALTQIDEELKQLAGTVQSEELKKIIDQQVKSRSQSQTYYIEALEERRALLGTPSMDWKTTDLEGKDHALQDYRGQVVVIDFWYRGCGWCIRAMPQVKEVASHFKGQPVRVLGMTTDRKLEDAKFVVAEMGLNYTNLKAPELPSTYTAGGFPTLLILDQQGVIRDVHVGYSPELKDEVIRSIEKLLATKP